MKTLRLKIAINVLLSVITLAALASVAVASFRPDPPEQSVYCTCAGDNQCGGGICRENVCVPYNGNFGKCNIQ